MIRLSRLFNSYVCVSVMCSFHFSQNGHEYYSADTSNKAVAFTMYITDLLAKIRIFSGRYAEHLKLSILAGGDNSLSSMASTNSNVNGRPPSSLLTTEGGEDGHNLEIGELSSLLHGNIPQIVVSSCSQNLQSSSLVSTQDLVFKNLTVLFNTFSFGSEQQMSK